MLVPRHFDAWIFVAIKLHRWRFLPEASFGPRVLLLHESVCPCVRPCVNPELVRAITCHLFKLEPPNLDQKCETHWLRSVCFTSLWFCLFSLAIQNAYCCDSNIEHQIVTTVHMQRQLGRHVGYKCLASTSFEFGNDISEISIEFESGPPITSACGCTCMFTRTIRELFHQHKLSSATEH